MRTPLGTNTHNINRWFIDEANSCSTNLLIQKSLTKYISLLLIPKGKSAFGQSLQNKVSRINELVLQNLSCKSYPKSDFYGCSYPVVVS